MIHNRAWFSGRVTLLMMVLCAIVCSCADKSNREDAEASSLLLFSSDVTTKGQLVESSSELTSVGVMAFSTADGGSVESSSPNFMYNQEVARSSSGEWYYNPARQWSEGGGYDNLTFFAYAPYVDSSDSSALGLSLSSERNQGVPYIEYQMAGEASSQPDLMVAQTAIDRSTGVVQLSFSHALAAIYFKVDCSSSNSVDALWVSGIIDSATLSMSLDECGDAQWSQYGDISSSSYEVALSSEYKESYTKEDNYLMVIPQRVGTQAQIVVTLRNRQYDFSFPDNTEWEAGQIYTYALTLDNRGGR